MSRFNDPFREFLEAEEFEAKLRRLAKMTPEQKKKHWYAIKEREKRFAFDHACLSEEIAENRRFEEEWRMNEPDFEGGEG